MRVPRLFRTTPFRLTLVFLALFAAAASAFLAYIYLATAGEVNMRADAAITREMQSLEATYRSGGFAGLNQAVIERTSGDRGFLYLLMNRSGDPISGSLGVSPVRDHDSDRVWASFTLNETDADGAIVKRPARGLQERMTGGELLFVASDVGEAEAYVVKIQRALWGASALVILLGMAGGVVVSRDVSRNTSSLTSVIEAVRGGDLRARAHIRGSGDEYDELAAGLNDMLDRLERSIGGLRHAGDAIAHDLRSPLTRLRARLETAALEADSGKGDPTQALHQALEDADGVLRTFAAVLAIARLEAAGEAPNPTVFDPGELAAGVAELYEPLCEEKGLEFRAELTPALSLKGNREFIAQALANILDNAVKYTPAGGAVMLRVRRRSSGDIEMSVTDTGPGVPEQERARVIQRFVRLENSRNEPGSGLGLSLVAAVAHAHKGALELDEGPGAVDGSGPGLRVALVLPKMG
ncbi:MAG TPA: HAMP domain-containing sensor histidine kinase [Caulobacteraceae bacterium]|nr:HAMP domain-containing sensor histidine kinase [Caulobacteraceae bacterium]